jgi:uncharacterized protein YjbI with pentapeptide repeats
MTRDPDTDAPLPPARPAPEGGTGGLGLLVFGFGLAAGLLLAFAGGAVLEYSAGAVLTALLAAFLAVAVLSGAVLLWRRVLWRRLFGVAETQLEALAAPMARVAEAAAARDPGGATAAARELVTLVLARYAWLATRRWVVTSLTALIAAMAALAGTALLYRQNQLIAVQSELLRDQNARIDEQSRLIETDVELAEAARNAALAVEITAIAAALGEAAVRAHGEAPLRTVNVLDPERDIDRGLVLRILSVSRALRPYRFLQAPFDLADSSDRLRVAIERRRADMEPGIARMAAHFGWAPKPAGSVLIDRPASPERGQLLAVMVQGGLRDLAGMAVAGLDLSFAHLQGGSFGAVRAHLVFMPYADLSGQALTEVDFGGATLDNARFRLAEIRRSTFSSLTADRAGAGIDVDFPAPTFLAGTEFTRARLFDVAFRDVRGTAAGFDGALLAGVDFTGASLDAATFRDALLLKADFSGASLARADFSGAVVFGADWAERTAANAAPEGFAAAEWRLVPMTPEEVMAIYIVQNALEPGEVAALTGGAAPFRVERAAPAGN